MVMTSFSCSVSGIVASEEEFLGGEDSILSGVDKFSFETEDYNSTMNGKNVVITQDSMVDTIFYNRYL